MGELPRGIQYLRPGQDLLLGYGQLHLRAVLNQYLALGLFNGLAIVAIAIIFDRVTQKFGLRMQKYRNDGKD